jgi:hypothetical protein
MVQGKSETWYWRNSLKVLCFSILLAASPGHGQSSANPGYMPPDSPELYDSNRAPGQKVDYGSHFFAGIGGGFGQSQASQEGALSQGSGLVRAELGYVLNMRATTRVETTVSYFAGSIGHSRARMDMNMGLMIGLGYGYQIGNRLWGVVRAGAGYALADFSGKTKDGLQIKAKEPVTGPMGHLGYYAISEVGSELSFFGGLQWNYFSMSLIDGSIVDEAGGSQPISDNYGISMPGVEVGLRIAI